MIEQMIFKGETLINVQASKKILLGIGLSCDEANCELIKHKNNALLDDIRLKRNVLLIEADYLVNIAFDSNVDVKPFREYRQKLRRITEDEKFLKNNVWPIKPEI